MLFILHSIEKYVISRVLTVFIGVLSYTTLLQTYGQFSLWSILYWNQNETQLYKYSSDYIASSFQKKIFGSSICISLFSTMIEIRKLLVLSY